MPKQGNNMDNKYYEILIITLGTIEVNSKDYDYKLTNLTEDLKAMIK